MTCTTAPRKEAINSCFLLRTDKKVMNLCCGDAKERDVKMREISRMLQFFVPSKLAMLGGA